MIPFLDMKSAYAELKPKLDAAYARVMESGWFVLGKEVEAFEAEYAAFCGTRHCVGLGNGLEALELVLRAWDLGPGDEVIVPSNTYIATWLAITAVGAKVVPVEPTLEEPNIDPDRIAAAVTSRTRAIMPVHLYGEPADMDAIMAVADKHGLMVIEDCAHAIETTYRGRKAGTFGDFGCFSFYATKNVVTGEGGMIVGRDEALIARAKVLALHGMSKDAWHRFGDQGYKHYQVVEAGFKYNMMDLQAAIGIHQLARVERNWRRREQIWNRYMEAFADLPIGLPAPLHAVRQEEADRFQPLPREPGGRFHPLPQEAAILGQELRGRAQRGGMRSSFAAAKSPTHRAAAPGDTRHAYHLFTITVDETRCGISRDAFLDAMNARRIGTGVHYLAVPEHPYYQQRFGWQPERWSNATRIGRQTVSLPLSPKLAEADVERVIAAVRDII